MVVRERRAKKLAIKISDNFSQIASVNREIFENKNKEIEAYTKILQLHGVQIQKQEIKEHYKNIFNQVFEEKINL
jgi:hypothetical protein